MRHVKFLIAGLIFELTVADGSDGFVIPSSYRSFQVADGRPDISVNAHSGMIPDWRGELIFDSNGPWRLWSRGEDMVLSLHNSPGKEEPYQVVMLDRDFTRAETFTEQSVIDGWADYFPMNYPLDEVVAVNRLAFGHGVEVHASGISDSGRGVLFLGVSGSGKSTISRLWDEEEGVLVLSDDRIIITRKTDGYWIHGTPWHGDAGLADPSGVKLEAIYFINHAPANSAAPLGAGQAASQLLARSFPTFWHKEGMQFTAGFTVEIAQNVPAYQLSFTPDRSAVEYVRKQLGF
ncbi:MAG: hypothetical protein M1539_04620 [Actinobacteria bacterium]|nr:hypothetical protein [Actinomycetota bacterium]MCL5883243.1 hypothetical protein [Actinomycetota bacterium]